MTEPTPGWAAPGSEPGPTAAAPPSYGPPPSYEPPSHEQPSHEQPSHEPPSHEPPSHEPPSHEPPSPYGPPPVGAPYGVLPGQEPPPVVPSWFAPPPVSGLGVAVLALSGLYLVVKVAEAVLVFRAQAQLVDGEPGAAVVAYGGAAAVEFLVTLAAWVMTSVWLMRLYRAAFAASPQSMRRSVAWTWLGWMVPIVSWWFPKQIVDDVWRVAGAQPGRTGAGPTGGWWAWWIVATLVDNVAGRLLGQDGAAGFVVFSALLTACAYPYWFRVVRGVSAAHDAGPWSTDAPVPPRPTPNA